MGANGSAGNGATVDSTDGAGADGVTGASRGPTMDSGAAACAEARAVAGAVFLAPGLGPGFVAVPSDGALLDVPPDGATGIASLSLRTTGASTVDDADRTNSPSSLSLVSTTLLSTPSSFASS